MRQFWFPNSEMKYKVEPILVHVHDVLPLFHMHPRNHLLVFFGETQLPEVPLDAQTQSENRELSSVVGTRPRCTELCFHFLLFVLELCQVSWVAEISYYCIVVTIINCVLVEKYEYIHYS